jgi:hypothetical protein
MSLDGSIKRVFGLEKNSPSEEIPLGSSASLAYRGYSSLSQVGFFIGLPVLREWRARHCFLFPTGCCVCLAPARKFLPSHGDPGWLGFFRKAAVVEQIPHCEEHGRGSEARLLTLVHAWSELVCHVSLVGLNEAFLVEAKRLNEAGDVPPPWRAFPGYSPFTSGWRQGNGEYWMRHAWAPFWSRLSSEDRARYLQQWAAPSEWMSSLD